jgi:hypothetical protein
MRLDYPDIPHNYSFMLEIDRNGFPAISGEVGQSTASTGGAMPQ